MESVCMCDGDDIGHLGRCPGAEAECSPQQWTSSALSSDEYSSSEAAGEKTEQNDDDNIKSQEVRNIFYIYLFRFI